MYSSMISFHGMKIPQSDFPGISRTLLLAYQKGSIAVISWKTYFSLQETENILLGCTHLIL